MKLLNDTEADPEALINRRQHQAGFTLIELMIVVAIIAILAAIAYPSYTEYVFKSRRADGHAALMRIELEQQKRRASGLAYTATLSDLGAAATSTDGHYNITLTAAGGDFTATAEPTGKQDGDSCGDLAISVTGGTATYEPSAQCWGR